MVDMFEVNRLLIFIMKMYERVRIKAEYDIAHDEIKLDITHKDDRVRLKTSGRFYTTEQAKSFVTDAFNRFLVECSYWKVKM